VAHVCAADSHRAAQAIPHHLCGQRAQGGLVRAGRAQGGLVRAGRVVGLAAQGDRAARDGRLAC
jgi:hypothetical protein